MKLKTISLICVLVCYLTIAVMGSEDFGLFGLDGHQIPTCMFFEGQLILLK